MTVWQQQTSPLLIAIVLCLGIWLATCIESTYTYASTIAVNSTYEVEVENMTSEQFDSLMDAESKANDQTNHLLNSIQTLEGLDIYSNECGYATEINPYKVIDCYYKNQDRIENAGKSIGR
jgi:surface antigen